MAELAELINYFCEHLQEHPPIPILTWRDICQSTVAYLNGYRQLQGMLDALAGKGDEDERADPHPGFWSHAEMKCPVCGLEMKYDDLRHVWWCPSETEE